MFSRIEITMRPKAPSLFTNNKSPEQLKGVVQHSAFCACDLCDTDPGDLPSTDPAPPCTQETHTRFGRERASACDCGSCLFARMPVRQFVLTPLARAALDNGVPFDDVQAYVARLPERIPLFELAADALLDIALDESAQAREPQKSRLWWQGVLT